MIHSWDRLYVLLWICSEPEIQDFTKFSFKFSIQEARTFLIMCKKSVKGCKIEKSIVIECRSQPQSLLAVARKSYMLACYVLGKLCLVPCVTCSPSLEGTVIEVPFYNGSLKLSVSFLKNKTATLISNTITAQVEVSLTLPSVHTFASPRFASSFCRIVHVVTLKTDSV